MKREKKRQKRKKNVQLFVQTEFSVSTQLQLMFILSFTTKWLSEYPYLLTHTRWPGSTSKVRASNSAHKQVNCIKLFGKLNCIKTSKTILKPYTKRSQNEPKQTKRMLTHMIHLSHNHLFIFFISLRYETLNFSSKFNNLIVDVGNGISFISGDRKKTNQKDTLKNEQKI